MDSFAQTTEMHREEIGPEVSEGFSESGDKG